LYIDASGRIYSSAYEGSTNSFNPSNILIFGAFDFKVAFPSVIHLWIWVVLHHRKMLRHFINLFKVIYKQARAEYVHNGLTYTLVYFLSGVLQRCPASAFLFNNALDPFLSSFHNILRANNAGIVRACADDIGISPARLKHLKLISPLYSDCETLAGLALKPIKCVLVPLCQFSPKVQEAIKRWLRRNIPAWADFKIAAPLLNFWDST